MADWREQVVGLLTEIRDLLAQQSPPAEHDDDGGRTEVTGD